MRHRWSSAFTAPNPLGQCVLVQVRRCLSSYLRIYGRGQVDGEKRETASLLCGVVQMDQQGKWISCLIGPANQVLIGCMGV